MKTPIPKVGLRFLIFGPLELAAAVIVGNSAVASNGIDNLVDGLYMTFGGHLDDRLAHSPRHERYCKLRGRLGIFSALIGIVMIGLGLLLERNNRADLAQMIVGLAVGSIGFWLTYKGHREVEGHGDQHHSGFDAHLLQDMTSSIVAALRESLRTR
jgi:hypothetical protein